MGKRAWIAYTLRFTAIRLKEWTDNSELVWMVFVVELVAVVPLQFLRMQKRRVRFHPPQMSNG
ncbi:MAG: hypothetical protein NTX25_14360 [Proteobacteria bacterium]|nr:hypothetical protein [Pseudomonadota bacterium]